jgi:Zn-dependent protease with chaperone function
LNQESIDSALGLIPSWVGYVSVLWLPAITFVLCAAVSYVSARVALLWADGLSSSYWTERARASYPARIATSWMLWACLGFMTVFLNDHHNSLLQISLTEVVAFCFPSAVLAIAVVGRIIARRLGDPIFPLARWARQFATRWLLSPWWLIVGVLFLTMPTALNFTAIAIATIGLMALLSLSLFGMPRLLCRIGLAWPAPPRLLAATREASEKMDLTLTAVYEIDIASANAFALPVPREVVFTRRALEVLDHEQLVAVCCHEIAHIAEPPKVKMIRIASSLLIFPLGLSNLVYSRFGEEGIFMLVAIVFSAGMRLRALRRRMETRADTAAHQHESDKGVYAAALEQIYRASNVPAVLSNKRAHRDLYDRMVAAGVTPTYPCPAPPVMVRAYVALALCVALLIGFEMGFDRWSQSSAGVTRLSEAGVMWRLAIGAAGAPAFARLAELRSLDKHVDQAATFYECATELDPYSVVYRAKLATAYSELGRCDEADEILSAGDFDLKHCSCGKNSAASAIHVAQYALGHCSPSDSL